MSESFRSTLLILVLACCPLAAGCGKDHTKAASTTQTTTLSDSTSADAETTVAAPDTTMASSQPDYKTPPDDPKAMYGMSDLPGRGSYLKLDLTGLTSAQLNRVVHRLRTEDCTCGCQGDLIDQCLVNDPDCTTAVQLAKQVIREEKMKS